MTSATENASATVAAPTPSFSYAQAARGLTPTSTSTPSSKTVSGSITPAKDAAPSSITHPQPNPNLHWTDEHSVTKSKELNTLNNVSESHNIHSNKAATSRKSQPLSNGSNSPPSPAYVDSSTSTLPREDDSSSIQNASSESTWENVSQASNLAERGIEGVEKGSKNEQKNDRDSWVKVQKPPQEAPVPTVNIWRQRMEAQSSVKKPETIPSTTVPTSTVSEIVPNSLPQKKAESTSTPPRTKDQEKIQSQKRGDDDAHKSRRSSAKKTSSEEKTRAAPPSIQDQTLWPTPESGLNVGDERKRSQDAAAKAEKEKHAAKGKNQWKHMEIQHTVVFQTPLPNTHARRGGRAAGRGGREGGARTSPSGANGTTSDKRNGSPTSGEFTKRDKDVTARGNSPGKVKRAVSDEPPTRRDSRFANQRDNREPGNAESRSNGKLEDRPNGHGPQHNTFSRHNPSKPNRRNDIPPTDLDKRKDSKGLTELPNGEPSNTEGSGNQQKPVQAPTDEEKKSFTSPELGSRGFGRGGAQPFVGNRRGNIRGKGPHGFHPPGSSHGFQPGFGMVRSPTIPNEPYFGQGNNSRLRGARNQTIPVDNTFGRFPAPFQSANMVAPINTFTGQPAGMYDYPVHPMSAVSYSPYMEQYQKLGSVAMQLEFYFTVDNLCKDMFLRKHMDSQGFVLLNVISTFKRLKSITDGDYDLLKFVAQQSHNIEYRIGVDGKERIRKRFGWEPFVFTDKSQRDESARHDGVESVRQRMPPQWSQQMPQHTSLPNPMSPREPMSAFTINGQGYPDFQRMLPNEMIDYSRFQMSPPVMSQPFTIPNNMENQGVRSPPQLGDFNINGLSETPQNSDPHLDQLVTMEVNGSNQTQKPINTTHTNGISGPLAPEAVNGAAHSPNTNVADTLNQSSDST